MEAFVQRAVKRIRSQSSRRDKDLRAACDDCLGALLRRVLCHGTALRLTHAVLVYHSSRLSRTTQLAFHRRVVRLRTCR